MTRSRFAESSNANPSGLAELAERITDLERLVAMDRPEAAHIALLHCSNVELQEQRHALQVSHDALFNALLDFAYGWPGSIKARKVLAISEPLVRGKGR